MRRDDWPLPDRAFHIAGAENWNSIQRTGPHGTTALIAIEGSAPDLIELVRDVLPIEPGRSYRGG